MLNMKKVLTILLAAVMLFGLFAQTTVAADVAPKFSEKFFPSGKANVPTDIYYQIGKEIMFLGLAQEMDGISSRGRGFRGIDMDGDEEVRIGAVGYCGTVFEFDENVLGTGFDDLHVRA